MQFKATLVLQIYHCIIVLYVWNIKHLTRHHT